MHHDVGPRVLLFLTSLIVAGTCAASRADDPPAAGLPDGWKSIVTLPECRFEQTVFSRKARLRLWTDKGWLIVRRETAEGDFDWQVVLAKATSAEKPRTSVSEQLGVFTLTYRGFFIREGIFGNLRIYRERKRADDPEWPVFEREVDPNGSSGSAGGGLDAESRTTLAMWEWDSWYWVQAGDRPDLWLKFQPKTLTFQEERGDRRRNPMMQASAGGPAEMRFGSASAFEEGDLFIAQRARRDFVERGLDDHQAITELGTAVPPALSASTWINAPEPPVLENLDNQVVLLAFWSESSPASIRNLKRLQALHETFKTRGLVVIAIYAGTDPEQATAIVKDKDVSFPVMFDLIPKERIPTSVGKPGSRHVTAASSGETTRKYLVDILPSCFLIDKTGKIAQGFGMAPPSEEKIESLLK